MNSKNYGQQRAAKLQTWTVKKEFLTMFSLMLHQYIMVPWITTLNTTSFQSRTLSAKGSRHLIITKENLSASSPVLNPRLFGTGNLRILSVPNSSPDGFCGGAGYGINAVCSAILFIIQEPARVCQATDLNPRISHLFQLLCYSIHIQENTCSTSTAVTISNKILSTTTKLCSILVTIWSQLSKYGFPTIACNCPKIIGGGRREIGNGNDFPLP